MSSETTDLRSIPRSKLTFTYSRRGLFKALLKNVEVLQEKTSGKAAYELDELGEWDNDRLAEITPQVIQGCIITIQDELVWGHPPHLPKPIPLFSTDSPMVIVFNQFNGINFLGEASHNASHQLNWDEDETFEYTRGFFLKLIELGICQPKF